MLIEILQNFLLKRIGHTVAYWPLLFQRVPNFSRQWRSLRHLALSYPRHFWGPGLIVTRNPTWRRRQNGHNHSMFKKSVVSDQRPSTPSTLWPSTLLRLALCAERRFAGQVLSIILVREPIVYTSLEVVWLHTDCNILIACTVRHGAPWNIGCHVKKTLTFHHRVTWEYRYSAIIKISSIMNSYTCYTCQRQMQNKEKKVKDEK